MIPVSEAENAVVALALSGSEEADELMEVLEPDHFISRTNRIVWESFVRLRNSGNAANLVTITDDLQARKMLEEVGGSYDLSRKHSLGVFTPGSCETFLQTILDGWRLRRLALISEHIKAGAESQESVNDLIKFAEASIYELNVSSKDSENVLHDGVQEVLKNIEAINQNSPNGNSTGIPSWDNVFGGILPGRYYCIGGRPGAGKTAMAEQIMLHYLLQGKTVLFVSRELRRDRVVGRLAAKASRTDYSRYVRRLSSSIELKDFKASVEALSKTNLILVTPSQMNGAQLRSLLRRSTRRHNVDLLVVDYLQLLDAPQGVYDATPATRENSKQLRAAINETGVSGLVVVQLNRDAAEGRPKMSNIKESGQIEQDADCIALLWKQDQEGDEVIMSIEKNRDGRPMTDERLNFDGPTMRFYEPNQSSGLYARLGKGAL